MIAAYFIYLTAHPSLYPMRKDMVEKFGDRWTEPGNIITNGPFLLKKWQHEYKIELAGNPQFFEGAPKLQTIKMFMIPELSTAFSLFENDELDYVDHACLELIMEWEQTHAATGGTLVMDWGELRAMFKSKRRARHSRTASPAVAAQVHAHNALAARESTAV